MALTDLNSPYGLSISDLYRQRDSMRNELYDAMLAQARPGGVIGLGHLENHKTIIDNDDENLLLLLEDI